MSCENAAADPCVDARVRELVERRLASLATLEV
jgi:hypothetical protein